MYLKAEITMASSEVMLELNNLESDKDWLTQKANYKEKNAQVGRRCSVHILWRKGTAYKQGRKQWCDEL